MDRKKYTSKVVDIYWKNRVIFISNLCLALVVLLLAFEIVQTKNSVQTILIPPDVNRPFSVKGDYMDKTYAEEMGRYYSQLYLTYSPKTAKAQFDVILQSIHANSNEIYKAKLYSDSDRIARNSISSVFYLLNLEGTKLTNGDFRVIVGGELKGLVGSQIISDEIAYFEFVFSFKGGVFSILSFNKMKRVSSNNEYIFVKEKEDNVNEKN